MLLKKGLSIPAYENVLKCSHTFNILDARGTVGVAERNRCFATMRRLAKEVTSKYLEKRKELGFPLLNSNFKLNNVIQQSTTLNNIKIDYTGNDMRSLVIEIGCEEVPPDELISAETQISTKMKSFLEEKRLYYENMDVNSTPRRLVIYIEKLQGKQKPIQNKVKGPPLKIAYDNEGKPEKALIGFCKKNSIEIDTITVEKGPKDVEFIFGIVKEEGRTCISILEEEMPILLKSISFKKSMRWDSSSSSSSDQTWSRPIRWILALYGENVLNVSFAGLSANNVSRGLRNSENELFEISSAESYFEALERNSIMLNSGKRKEVIWCKNEELARSVNGKVPIQFKNNGLLEEVCNLIEYPNVILGSFSTEFLKLPQEILTSVMTKNQRYFPLHDKNDHLKPYFILVANGRPIDTETVRLGNEAVLRARFEDAQFFYQEDTRHNLEYFIPKLEGIIFESKLGNMLEKCQRTQKLIKSIMSSEFEMTSFLKINSKDTLRAAHLYRADLSTSMVMEMTSLAGFIGKHYAEKAGENDAVCQAIFESVLPRTSGDVVPKTPSGILLSLSDKIDSLVGLIAAGRLPSATADPYGLRRMAYGLIECLILNKVSFSLDKAISLAVMLQPIEIDEKMKNEIKEFLNRRLEQLLCDRGIAIEAGIIHF